MINNNKDNLFNKLDNIHYKNSTKPIFYLNGALLLKIGFGAYSKSQEELQAKQKGHSFWKKPIPQVGTCIYCSIYTV